MRMKLRQWGAFCLVAGLATSSLAVATATPAAARRMPHGHQAGAWAADTAPRWEYGQTAWREEGRDRSRRSARRQAAHAHRVSHGGYRHTRGRDVQRVERRRAAVAGSELARLGNRRAAAQATQAWKAPDSGFDQRYAVDRRAAPSASGKAAYASGGSGNSLVSEARRWLGTNPTQRRTLWCGAFMNFVLERTGHKGSGSDLARSFASAGQRVSGPQVGAIAVMARRGGGHVGVVSGIDPSGNPIIISGNHRRTVAETVYPRGRIYAYVMPR